ncbi:MAG: carboxylesterase family protein [Hyphomonadaceae bacterium]|nr:carboxylesterase family protein [Hyphomonadaceae bacterium]
MKWILIILAALMALAAAAYGGLIWMITQPAPPLEKGPVLTLSQGEIQAGTDRDNPDILQINGIPFAGAPVGDLRWRPPTRPANWEGVRDGTEFGAECIQARSGSSEFLSDLLNGMGLNAVQRHLATVVIENGPPPVESEDCLFLNVRTANAGSETLQPVMVWIHGGSHQTGSGSLDIYQANQLVENGVVLVTINYRLGPFGYLAHPALSADDENGVSGNYGLLDQVASLIWIRDNIQVFGGDPDNVTIFGESAGAQSVTEIMSTPLSEGLFHKAILQSGASTYNANGLTTAIEGRMSMHEAGLAFMDGLAPRDASAADLRAIPATEIIAHIPNKMHLGDYVLPTVDGLVIPKLMGQAIGDGSIHNVPILAGYNADEATLFYSDIQKPTILVPEFPEALDDRLDLMREIYGETNGNTLIDLYGLDDPETYQTGETDMLGDDLFGVHMRYLAKSNTTQGAPSYLYHFTRIPPSKSQTIGAFHAAEIFFVFGSHSPLAGLTEEDKVLTEAMGKYWTNFAKTGDPNGAGLPAWPVYDPAIDEWMTFNPSIEVKQGVRAEKLDILEETLVRRVAAAATQITPAPEFSPGSGSQEIVADSLEP